MNTFNYKGFIGSIETSIEDRCLYGKLLFIHDLITYEAQTVAKLEAAFKKSVNDYIKTCKKMGKEPQKPFKGSLNVRIGPQLHKAAAIVAAEQGITINQFIKTAIEHEVQSRAY